MLKKDELWRALDEVADTFKPSGDISKAEYDRRLLVRVVVACVGLVLDKTNAPLTPAEPESPKPEPTPRTLFSPKPESASVQLADIAIERAIAERENKYQSIAGQIEEASVLAEVVEAIMDPMPDSWDEFRRQTYRDSMKPKARKAIAIVLASVTDPEDEPRPNP